MEKYKSEEYKLQSFSLCNFLSPPVALSLGSSVLLSTLFSNNLNQYSSLRVRDQLSQPYKRTDTIIILHTLISRYLDRT